MIAPACLTTVRCRCEAAEARRAKARGTAPSAAAYSLLGGDSSGGQDAAGGSTGAMDEGKTQQKQPQQEQNPQPQRAGSSGVAKSAGVSVGEAVGGGSRSVERKRVGDEAGQEDQGSRIK